MPFFLPFLSFFDFFAMVTPPPYGVERCAFLASDAARYMVGAAVDVNGGIL